MRYLSVKNLDKYQHYKDRDPKWIKLYYSILDDPIFMLLSEVDRCRYMTCLIIASRTNNQIPDDSTYLKKIMRLDKAPDLRTLISRGFLIPCEPSSICLDTTYTVEMGPNHSLLSSPLLSSSDSDSEIPKVKSNGHTKEKNGATIFPEEWKLTSDEAHGWREFGIDPAIEFATFRDHARTNDRRCHDWHAAWRNWARKALKLKEEKRYVQPLR